MLRSILLSALLPVALLAQRADSARFREEIEKRTTVVLPKVVAWRRDLPLHATIP